MNTICEKCINKNLTKSICRESLCQGKQIGNSFIVYECDNYNKKNILFNSVHNGTYSMNDGDYISELTFKDGYLIKVGFKML